MIPLRDDIPTRRFPVVTVSLIAVNTLVFLFEALLGSEANQLIDALGIVPHRFITAPYQPLVWLTLITAMYLHGGWMHLIGNMLYLWIFGNNVEDNMGRGRFFIFYTLSGLISGLAEIAASPNSMIPGIGASGAIAGVLGAYLLLYPHAKVRTLVPLPYIYTTVDLPASLVLGSWFVMQLFNGVVALSVVVQTGGIAWWAHIGGFVAGMLLLPLFRRREPPAGYSPYGGLYDNWRY